MSSLRSQAIDIIKQKGLKKLPEPIQLASGAMSHDFVDGKLATAHFDDLEIASRAIVDGILLQGIEFDVVVSGKSAAVSGRAIDMFLSGSVTQRWP